MPYGRKTVCIKEDVFFDVGVRRSCTSIFFGGDISFLVKAYAEMGSFKTILPG